MEFNEAEKQLATLAVAGAVAIATELVLMQNPEMTQTAFDTTATLARFTGQEILGELPPSLVAGGATWLGTQGLRIGRQGLRIGRKVGGALGLSIPFADQGKGKRTLGNEGAHDEYGNPI